VRSPRTPEPPIRWTITVRRQSLLFHVRHSIDVIYLQAGQVSSEGEPVAVIRSRGQIDGEELLELW
jgi:hypothetical protein